MGDLLRSGKILIVDDNVELAENIAEILSVAGYDAVIASSAEAALERVKQGDIVGAVTDFRLPGMSGADLIAQLRRLGNAIPVAVMSAYSDAGIVESAEAAGALDFMPKPLDLERLRGVVDGFDEEVDVLVVDDNAELAQNLADVLRTRGLSPQIGTSAREALALRRQAKAALIDYRLPDRDGLHVALRLIARNPRIRILFVSALGDGARAHVAQALPDVQCLPKPVDPADLLSWATAIGGRSQRH